MKPIQFKHQTTIFAENQPEYIPIPTLKIDSPNGEVISCWSLSFKERIRVLIFGEVWMSLSTFNKPLTPSMLSTNRKDLYFHPEDNIKWWKFYFLKNKTMKK